MRDFTTIAILGACLLGCAMDGGPGALVLDRAWWRAPGELRVSLWASPPGQLWLDHGGGVSPGDADCRGERCVVTWRDVEAPAAVRNRVAGRESGAPLLACGVDPFGLCPFGYTCVEQACVPRCSPAHPSGACTADGAVCEDGWCVLPEG